MNARWRYPRILTPELDTRRCRCLAEGRFCESDNLADGLQYWWLLVTADGEYWHIIRRPSGAIAVLPVGRATARLIYRACAARWRRKWR